jgi:hypothetical protein
VHELSVEVRQLYCDPISLEGFVHEHAHLRINLTFKKPFHTLQQKIETDPRGVFHVKGVKPFWEGRRLRHSFFAPYSIAGHRRLPSAIASVADQESGAGKHFLSTPRPPFPTTHLNPVNAVWNAFNMKDAISCS